MAEKGSVYQKGGGGTNFEQLVQSAFLTTLIIQGNAPCIPSNKIIEVSFQCTNRGYETDDLLVIAESSIGRHRLIAQIKNNLTFTSSNAKFIEVIKAFWIDFNNEQKFDKTKDRLLIIISGLNKHERNHLKSILNWAKTHATESDFYSEVKRISGKQKILEVFSECLKLANNGVEVNKEDIWCFLRCLDVLEYDFQNEGSTHRTYFLNLIKLSKRQSSELNEQEIWRNIVAFSAELNSNGGSVTSESIQQKPIYKYFDPQTLSPYFKSIEKLEKDSQSILLPIKNTIGGLHLKRPELLQKLTEAIDNNQITIVTGKPGIGKSAIVKDLLKSKINSSSFFVFHADQFNVSQLANVFSNQGINESLNDILSCISLLPDKVIVIDSLEKLLEGDSENAFKQLLFFVKQFPKIKIIGISRRYAIDLLFQKFEMVVSRLGIVETLSLNQKELRLLEDEFPQLNGVLQNSKLQKLLERPKYLDFVISAIERDNEDYTEVTISQFREKLWNSLVKNSSHRIKGLPAKREDAFIQIAVTRAKKMKLFIKPVGVDEEAIDYLENDEIIFQENLNRKYSPTHDILEDWALIKYIDSIEENLSSSKELFETLANQPAIRRAFRLWVEDNLVENQEKVFQFIRISLQDKTINKYWADELLVAIFKSEDCVLFFQRFEKELLEKNANLLNRCIRLIRTACKERNIINKESTLLIPIGSGWREAIHFIVNNLEKLNTYRIPICNLIFDWEYKTLFNAQIEDTEKENVKSIVISFISQIENGDSFWDGKYRKNQIDRLISLLFNLASIAKAEITTLINRSFEKQKDNSTNWRIKSFYKKIIEKSLSGLATQNIVKELPELIISTAWKAWKFKVPEEKKDKYFPYNNPIDENTCWGIGFNNHNFYPSGIYKTPLYNLLRFHPILGLEFIVNFLNYCIDFYRNSNYEHKYEMWQVEMLFPNGEKKLLWASSVLWQAYRGLSVTHYAIISLLISLEKHLLELAKIKTETSRSSLHFVFDYLICNTNNIAIISVLASVAQAHPKEVGEKMLPLFSVLEFYDWEITRYSQEFSSSTFRDYDIPFAQEENNNFNQLPHRKKYRNGLQGLVIDCQINLKTWNEDIHKIFDQLWQNIDEKGIIKKKQLNEIDLRKWEATESHGEHKGIIIQPKYEEDVSNFVNQGKSAFEAQNLSAGYFNLLRTAYEDKETIGFEKWKEICDYYQSKDSWYDSPITLSVIGLSRFQNKLNLNHKKWCIDKIIDTISLIIQNKNNIELNIERKYNFMEEEIALSSFHYIFQNVQEDEKRNSILLLMAQLFLVRNSAYPTTKEYTSYLRSHFFSIYPLYSKRLWKSLLLYSKNQKSPNLYDNHNRANKIIKKKEPEFLIENLNYLDVVIDFEEMNLETCLVWFLPNAFLVIPFDTDDKDYLEFIEKFLNLIIEDIQLEQGSSYTGNKEIRQINYKKLHACQLSFAEIVIQTDWSFAQKLIDILFDALSIDVSRIRHGEDLFDFINQVFTYVLLITYDAAYEDHKQKIYPNIEKRFWKVWKYLVEKIKVSKNYALLQVLFCNWRHMDNHMKPFLALANDSTFFRQMISDFQGKGISQYLIKLFSGIGKDYLPNGLHWLVEALKKESFQEPLITTSAKELVKIIYYNYISQIKNDKKLIADFIWMLDQMIDLGSSEAYIFRENVIVYKKEI